MKRNLLLIVSTGVLVLSAAGCSGSVEANDSAASVSDELASCPAASTLDSQHRAAATIAFNIMRHSASITATMPMNSNVRVATASLASQRFRIQSSGVGIEWDPFDPLYQYVNDDMKADLAFGQLDEGVAKYLSDGLKYDMVTTNGLWYPSIRAISALANFTYPGPTTTTIPDSTATSHTATVKGEAWCDTELVTINERVVMSWGYSPIYKDQVQQWRTQAPFGYSSTANATNTPFNGALAAGNPYLVVSVNGMASNWATYNFQPVSCYNFYYYTCFGQIQVDPVPYAEPAAYYNAAGLVGTQANPFSVVDSYLTATREHAGQWATRVVGGVPETGQFATPITLFGKTQYRFKKL